MNPEQAAFLRDFTVTALEGEAQTTRRVLQAVPEKGNDYRPDPKSRSGFELALHIASADAWFLSAIVAGEFKMESDSTSVPPEIKSVADIVGYYDKNYVAKLSQLKSLSGDKLTKMTNFLGAFNYPLVVYVQFLKSHQVHHRGQLSAYLRAMGGKVPSIYGGSADEPFQMGASA